jgi:hypothetical protein
VNRDPAAAQIQLALSNAGNGGLRVQASAQAPGSTDALALYVALTQNHLVSKVARGENGGSTLTHEHVVRSWMGPFRLVDGSSQMQVELSAADQGRLAQGELVAFVENERTGHVLQAVGLPACRP